MPRPRSAEPFHRTHLRLYARDWDELGKLYGDIGRSDAVRRIVRAFLVVNRGNIQEAIDRAESQSEAEELELAGVL